MTPKQMADALRKKGWYVLGPGKNIDLDIIVCDGGCRGAYLRSLSDAPVTCGTVYGSEINEECPECGGTVSFITNEPDRPRGQTECISCGHKWMPEGDE